MKKISTVLVLLITCTLLNAQVSATDGELNYLAKLLTEQVKGKMTGQNIALADFVDENDQPSQLGKYLAEELSFVLVNNSNDFNMIDRTKLRLLLKEAGLGEKGMIDPSSVQKLGQLKGITAVVYGKLIPFGNFIKVYTKVVILEGQENVITVRSQITRTPTIESFTNNPQKPITPDCDCDCDCEGTSNTNSSIATYSNQNIKIDLIRCTRNGSNVDCQLQVTSLGKGDNFSIQGSGTALIDSGGRNYSSIELSMNGRNSSMQAQQPLSANTPAPVIVRFGNIPASLSTVPLINLSCRSYSAFAFKAQFQNISIQ